MPGHFLERAVAEIAVKAIGADLGGDEQVEKPVIIVIGPGSGDGIRRGHEASLPGNVGESAVAVVAQQARPHGMRGPSAPNDEEVQEAVVVVIGLDEIKSSVLLAQPGCLGAFLEGAVALVSVKRHGLAWVPRGGDDVQKAVVVEIVHHGAARLVEAVDPDEVADVPKAADVKLGPEALEGQTVLAGHLARMFSEGHVSQVQQPAHPHVIGELPEVLGEMFDRKARALGLGVNGG